MGEMLALSMGSLAIAGFVCGFEVVLALLGGQTFINLVGNGFCVTTNLQRGAKCLRCDLSLWSAGVEYLGYTCLCSARIWRSSVAC